MENIIIRKALIKDLDLLLTFEQGIVNAERSFDPTLKEGIIHYYDIKEMIGASDVEVIIAELNNEIIGSGYAHIKEAKSYLQHEYYAHLGFMYVVPAHRGKGVNNRIMEALKQWANSQNVTEIRLEVYNDNFAAVKAYEKAGFVKYMVEMRLS